MRVRARLSSPSVALLVLVVATGTSVAVGAQPPQSARDTVIWNRSPIHVSLTVGEQRRVTFPGTVLFGQTRKLTGKLEVQNVKDTLYFTAGEAFGPTQALVRECVFEAGTCTPEGDVYLLALTAKAGKHPGRPLFVERAPADEQASATGSPTTPAPLDPVALVRHAAQQLYAPTRLLRESATIHRAPVPRDGTLPLYEGGAFGAAPLAAWTDGRLHITAVELRNRTPTPQPLDLRAIRGRWLSRTMLAGHGLLPPMGHPQNRTTVLLVSPMPFEEATAWLR